MTRFALAMIMAASLTPPAMAQELDPLASPFAFADSNLKAERPVADDSSASRVIGGQVAEKGAWPWQVGLMIAGAPMRPSSHFCGGSMVMDRWVLTAAHCVHMADKKGNFADLAPSRINVLVGTNRIGRGGGELVQVEAIFRHPDYKGDVFDHDIALMKLLKKPDVPFKTINIPNAETGNIIEKQGVNVTVTGWGLIDGGLHPAELHQTTIQMLPREACNRSLMESRTRAAAEGFDRAANVLSLDPVDAYAAWQELIKRAPEPISKNMVCSGTYEGGKTACSGDSGGPLVVKNTSTGEYLQAGVVSWGLSGAGGKKCNENAKFSAYTRTANYVEWLNSVIRENP